LAGYVAGLADMSDAGSNGGLPQGGGAIAGLGEMFSPDLHTGTGNLSIPLPLIKGRNGLTPSLALSYSSGAGNGPFGLGWDISVPRIARRTDKKLPTYRDTGPDADTFVLAGAEEFTPVPLGNATPADLPAGASATRYRPRTETTYARIVHVTGAGHDYWDVRTQDGLRNWYGTPRPSPLDPDVPDDWTDRATITTPDGRIYAWLLSATVDPCGNHIRYEYRPDGAQRYLQSVEYADYGDPDHPSYALRVDIAYQSRPDPFSDRKPGFDLRTTLRATRIDLRTPGSMAEEAPGATRCELTYADQSDGSGAGDHLGHSLLARVQFIGHDADAEPQDEPTPPVTFTYRDFQPARRHYEHVTGSLPPAPLGGPLDLVDLFGDGLPSVLQLDGGTGRYWRNRGNGHFDPPQPLANAPAGATLGACGVALADLDGDGRPELAVSDGTNLTVWAFTRPDGDTLIQPGFQPVPLAVRTAPTVGLADPQVRLVDLDGNHRLDLLLAGSPPRVADGDGTGSFTNLRPLDDAPPPLADPSDPRVKLADMTGDGLTDVVWVHNGAVRYWPSLGHGRYDTPVDMGDPPTFDDAHGYGPVGFDPTRLLLGDVTGDGTADLIYVEDGRTRIWVNQSGNRYAEPSTILGTPPVTSSTGVRLADLHGTGVTGIVWSGLGADQHWAFLDLTGGTKPYLLTGIDNHRGAAHSITWATSTQYATADRTAGQPWATSLPFPVHVVTSSQTLDAFAHTVLTEAYAYHDGYWDPVDREFRGFGRVEHTDTLHGPSNDRALPPTTITALDPLTPASPLPAGFDANENGNLLANWSFDIARDGQPRVLETTSDHPFAPGESAAEGWTTWNNRPGKTTTTVERSSLPMGVGGNMLRVTTTTGGCGVVQAFQPVNTGPSSVVASVWMFIVKGAVHLGTGNGGDIAPDVMCDTTGRWVLLEAGNQRQPANELIVYATGPGETEFLLDHAWVRVADVPATPLDSPPVRTVTWFHPGPVGPTAGRWGLVSQPDQYWPGDPVTEPQVDLTPLPEGLDPTVLRDALRALRGQVLRNEVYADDGEHFLANRPYTVHTARYQVAPVLDGRSPTATGWLRSPVVAVQPTETTDTTWDRGTDPMTRLQLTRGYDEYGRPSVVTAVAVPRGRRPDDPTGHPCLVTVTRTEYATADRANLYRLDRVARTSRHEVLDPGTTTVHELAAAASAGDYRDTDAEQLRALELTYYDGDAFAGLGCGELGDHGLPVRTEQLALTADLLARLRQPLYDSGAPAPALPYLADGGATSTDWGPEYPALIQDALTRHPGPHLGYQWHDDTDTHAAGYYVQTSRFQYDLHDPGTLGRGLTRTSRAADGSDTITTWDEYALHPATVTDAAELTTRSEYDARTLKATLVTDPNGNRTQCGWTPLGLPAWIARLGHAGQTEGDTVEHPGIWFTYRLLDYDDTAGAPDTRLEGQPVSVTTTKRVDHVWTLIDRENTRRAETGQPPLAQAEAQAMFGPHELEEHPERFVVAVEFSDGLGRLLQTRTQADPVTVDDLGLDDIAGQARRTVTTATTPGRVIVSGWRVMDNKGREVLSYEPFFDDGYLFTEPGPVTLAGQTVTQHHYDPRGRVTVTVAPDGSQTLVVHGKPVNPRRPARYDPTPWQTYTYGAAANGGRTHPTTTLPESTRWNAMMHCEVDALGRVVHLVERATDHDLNTHTSYDIDGRILTVTDPLGRDIARHRYDHRGQEWSSWLLDAGHRHTARDAAGAIIEQLDDRGARHVTAFDGAHRPTRTWARDRSTQALTLRAWSVYGDESTRGPAAAAANVLGRITFHYDDAGQTHTPAYDLGGNPRSTTWRPIRVDLLLAGATDGNSVGWKDTAYAVDWPGPDATGADDLLDSTAYGTEVEYDALGRPVTDNLPADTAGHRTHIERSYGLGGAVTGITVNGHPFVVGTVYDAHGRRQLLHLANGTLTRYTYDPRDRQLRRRRTDIGAEATANGWTCGTSAPICDHTFRYDLAGNVLTLADRTSGCGIPPADLNALDRQFSYDTLDRLLTATGRETDLVPAQPWIDIPRSTDPTQARRYQETYSYDDAGNLIHLGHDTDNTARGSYTRTLTPHEGSNSLRLLETRALRVPYSYDAAGNLLLEADNRRFEWDHAGRLATFRDQTGPANAPTVYAQYRYHGTGERAMKLVRRGKITEVTVYVGAFRRTSRTTGNERYDEVSVLHGETRVATLRLGPLDPDARFPDQPVLYEATDHLASVTDTLSATGEVLNREEYLPFGETAFGSYTHKRHRYTGRERDEESGLSYHHARYYLPWLARWASCDPSGPVDGPSLYAYARNNPTGRIDPTGLEATSGQQPDKTNTKLTGVGGAGAGVRSGAPRGPTLKVPDTYGSTKMQGYGRGVVKGQIGKVTNTEGFRRDPAHRAAERAFQATEKQPVARAPSGRYDADHIIELQHDITGKSGTNATRDFQWQDSRLNRSEGAISRALQAEHPGITPAELATGKKPPTIYGGIAKAAEAERWYHSEAARGAGRGLGTIMAVYGAYESGKAVAGAVGKEFTSNESYGQYTAREVASQAAGWAGAMALGAEGAAWGAAWGSLVPGVGTFIGGAVGGLIGGGIGYYIGQQASTAAIDRGVSATNARQFVPHDLR